MNWSLQNLSINPGKRITKFADQLGKKMQKSSSVKKHFWQRTGKNLLFLPTYKKLQNSSIDKKKILWNTCLGGGGSHNSSTGHGGKKWQNSLVDRVEILKTLHNSLICRKKNLYICQSIRGGGGGFRNSTDHEKHIAKFIDCSRENITKSINLLWENSTYKR